MSARYSEHEMRSGIRGGTRILLTLGMVTVGTLAIHAGCGSKALMAHGADGSPSTTLGTGGLAVGGRVGDGQGGQGPGGTGGGVGGTGGNNWTDPNCYMRCGQGNAVYYGGAGGQAGGVGGISSGESGGVMGSGGYVLASDGGGMAGTGGSVSALDSSGDDCSMALPISCGDQVNHSTLTQGRGNVWQVYNTSQRVYSGPETLYAFRPTSSCQVIATLMADDAHPASGELVLFLFTGCSMSLNTSAGSQANFTAEAGHTYYLVVDGVNGAAGSYYLRVDCVTSN